MERRVFTLYSPVTDDYTEVQWLLFCVAYRFLVFICFLTAIS